MRRDPREEYYDLLAARNKREREASRKQLRRAPVAALPQPTPAPIAPPPAAKSAAEREFDRVKAAALKRIAAEEAARAAEDAAVRSIIDARAAANSHLS